MSRKSLKLCHRKTCILFKIIGVHKCVYVGLWLCDFVLKLRFFNINSSQYSLLVSSYTSSSVSPMCLRFQIWRFVDYWNRRFLNMISFVDIKFLSVELIFEVREYEIVRAEAAEYYGWVSHSDSNSPGHSDCAFVFQWRSTFVSKLAKTLTVVTTAHDCWWKRCCFLS